MRKGSFPPGEQLPGDSKLCLRCAERDELDLIDRFMDRLIAIGIFLLIVFWALILLVVIGIALDVPGSLFQAH